MIFKDPALEIEFRSINCLLQGMALELDAHVLAQDMPELICTRILEPISGSSGVHEDCRAIDFRDEHGGVFL